MRQGALKRAPLILISVYGYDKLCKHRFSFRKSELADKLDTFDPNKTEVQNIKDNGWFRIFDCGDLRYALCL